jgi:hypothetical protein
MLFGRAEIYKVISCEVLCKQVFLRLNGTIYILSPC